MNIILGVLNAKYVHSSLSVRYLSAYCNEYEIDIFESTINENPMDNAMKIINRRPDIIGFSCYIWNIEQTLKLCSMIKNVLPQVKMILGGPEVSYDSEEILNKYNFIDYVISGEGEVALKQLLNVFEDGTMEFDNILGLSYRMDGEIRVNTKGSVIADLNEIPFPYKCGIPEKIVYYEASRGCPYNCGYCLSSTIKGLRYFNIERVKSELQFFIDNEVQLVKFVDRTFNANKSFAIEIWDFLIRNSKSTRFHFEISADILSPEEILLLRKAPKGMFQFEIGVQTTNPMVLKNINRIMNFGKVKDNVEAIMELENIHCHLDLIAGLPGENIQSFKNSFDMVMSLYPNALQIGFLKILKGAPIFNLVEEYGIRYMDFPPYQVLCTKDISSTEMSMLLKFEEVFEVFYNSGVFDITIKYIMSFEASPFDFFIDFMEYLDEREYFCRKYDLKDKFKFLYDYLVLRYDQTLTQDLMLHDYILNTKKAYLPDFLKREIDDSTREKIKKLQLLHENKNNGYKVEGIIYYPCSIQVTKWKNSYKVALIECLVGFDVKKMQYKYY